MSVDLVVKEPGGKQADLSDSKETRYSIMAVHLQRIAGQLIHLQRMREDIAHLVHRCKQFLSVSNWCSLNLKQHETLSAFGVSFSEFQVHLCKSMRATAIGKEVEVGRFGSVLNFIEKLGVLESVGYWKIIHELRNAVNHECEEEAERLTQFFMEMINASPVLFACHQGLLDFCREAYGTKPK